MNAKLRLYLLGTPEFWVDDCQITQFNSNKTRALLVYLAVTGRSHMRTALAGLFWGEMPEEKAHTNLRKSIANLKKSFAPWLTITRQAVMFTADANCWVDLHEFGSAIAPDIAVDLYRGDFLEGLYIDQTAEFEHWVVAQRARWREKMLQDLFQAIHQHTNGGDYAGAITACQRLLTMEAWREEAHQQLMMLYARSRQRSAALAQYESCRQVLMAELGILPAEKTDNLYKRILKLQSRTHNLPLDNTPFIGRDAELADLQSELKPAGNRCVTILGPGGIGKTRLALAAAAASEEMFLEGCWFVDLTSAENDKDAIAAEIGRAIGMRFASRGDAHQQLIAYLQDKEKLLVLDNLEHIVSEAAALCELILESTREIKLLNTTRQALQLHEEIIWELNGLAIDLAQLSVTRVPSEEDTQSDVPAPAAQLFATMARRQNRQFRLADQRREVNQICALVEGSPLAIELAAAITRQSSCQEVADRIQTSLDVLESQFRNTPKRHHSLRAVFDHSWELLSPEQQRAFIQLSVFRGPFGVSAAANICQLPVEMLHALVSRSLLRIVGEQSFALHELLRQFAHERLMGLPADYLRLGNLHADYFVKRSVQLGEQISSENSVQVQNELRSTFANLADAWRWYIKNKTYTESPAVELRRWLNAIFMGGHVPSGYLLFSDLCSFMVETDPVWPHLQTCLAYLESISGRIDLARDRIAAVKDSAFWDRSLYLRMHAYCVEASLLIKVGQASAAQEAAKHGLDLATQRSAEYPPDRLELVLLNQRGNAFRRTADYDSALAAFETLEMRAAEMDDYYHRALAMQQMGIVHQYYLNDQEAALPLYLRSLEYAEPLQHQALMADSYASIGNIYCLRGKQEKSLEYLLDALQIYRQLGEPITEGLTLTNLCFTYDAMERVDDIKQCAWRGVEILSAAKADFYEADCRALNSSYAIMLGDFERAEQYLDRALSIARENESEMLLARALWRYIHLKLTIGDLEGAAAGLKEAQALPVDKLSAERRCGITLMASLYHFYLGEIKRAADIAQEAVKLAAQLPLSWQGRCATHAGYVALAAENWELALTQFEAAEACQLTLIGGSGRESEYHALNPRSDRMKEIDAGVAYTSIQLGEYKTAKHITQELYYVAEQPDRQRYGMWMPAGFFWITSQLMLEDEHKMAVLGHGYEFLRQQANNLPAAQQDRFWQSRYRDKIRQAMQGLT